MTKSLRKIFYTIIPVIALLFIQSCAEDPDPSLFELIDPDATTPVIASIEPTGQAVAGVTVITVNGSDFSDDASRLVVSFNGVSGQIVQTSPTQILVKVPNVIADSVAVRVSKIDAEPFSNLFQYKLTPALAEIKKDETGSDLFSADLIPKGITTDAQGNLLVSVTQFNANIGIKKITPVGEIVPYGTLQDFAPPGGSGGSFFHQLNIWQNNTIIAIRRVAAVFQQTEGATASVFTSQMQGASIYDVDVDQNMNVFAGGIGSSQGGPSLFRINPALEVKAASYFSPVKAVRVYDNYLYVLTTVTNEDIIRRFPIIAGDSLGNSEDVFNIGQSVLPDTGTSKIAGTDFDIAADGDIILGTTKATDPIVVIHTDGTFEPLYPGVVPQNTRVFAFAWDPGNYLYFNRDAFGSYIQTILRLDMQKPGAPYFGR